MTIALPLSMVVLAQASAGGGPNTNYVFAFELLVMFGILYFIVLRPQQKQRQRHEASLRELKKGDEVVTASGIVGDVIHIREMSSGDKRVIMDDRVTIKSGESRLVIERRGIARILGINATSSPAAPAS